METNRIFICLGYLVIFSASSSKSLDHYECSQEGSQVIKALKGGHIKGKETVIDFHRDEPLIPGSYECHVTADVSGYLYVSVLRVPLVEHCGTEVTVEKQTIIKRACNYGDIVPSMHLINKTSPLLLKLQILTEPHNSDYCFQLSGNVELNIECKSNHVTCDVQNVLLFGFGIVGLLLLLMLFRNKSFEVNQLFFTSQKGPKKINMTCTGSLQYPTLHVGQTVEKNHLILSTNTYPDQMGFASAADRILSWVVPVIFILSAFIKLYSGDMPIAVQMRHDFIKYAPTCPTQYFGYIPKPGTYQTVVGIWELFCAVGLFFSRDLKRLTSGILCIIMIGAVYTHIVVEEYERTLPPIIFFLMCFFLNWRARNGQSEKVKKQ